MKIHFRYKNKYIEIDLKNCNFINRFFGLMFVKKKNAKALLFNFKKPVSLPIHSLFVFFPFVAIWLDNKNRVIESQVVKPFRFHILPKRKYCKLVEIPINRDYSGILKNFDLNMPWA